MTCPISGIYIAWLSEYESEILMFAIGIRQLTYTFSYSTCVPSSGHDGQCVKLLEFCHYVFSFSLTTILGIHVSVSLQGEDGIVFCRHSIDSHSREPVQQADADIITKE